MSDLEASVLRMLRLFGPCSNYDVARRLRDELGGHFPGRTYRALYRLCVAGLAVHPKKQAWDISRLGREYFERMPTTTLRLFERAEG